MEILTQPFGAQATSYTLINDHGVALSVTDFGARIVSLRVPLATGERELVLGFDSAEEYQQKDTFIGATIGRVAGRIAGAHWAHDGVDYQFEANENDNTLHSGVIGFDQRYWQAAPQVTATEARVVFAYVSEDGENGFPGQVTVNVTYALANDNVWRLTYEAVTDTPTLFNPTNHVYFNLTGDPSQSVAAHQLKIAADTFAPIGDKHLTTGEIRSVAGTSFDFRAAKPVGTTIESTDDQHQRVGHGLDHPFLLQDTQGAPQAELLSPDGLVRVAMTTTAPAVVVFTGNFGTDFTLPMRQSQLKNHGGITLETQAVPGAERFASYGDIVLTPASPYQQVTEFKLDF